MIAFKPGDLICVSSKGPVSWGIQLGSLSLPNLGPLGRWGWAGASHVGILVPVYNRLLVYESTSFNRPPCVRTGREEPRGVQAHFIEDIVKGGGHVWHYPLRRRLYEHEEDRLLEAAEECLGRGYDFLGAGKSGGGLAMRYLQRRLGHEDMGQVFCSELVVYLWCQVGLMQHKNAGAWNPERLRRFARRRGICGPGQRLSLDVFANLAAAA